MKRVRFYPTADRIKITNEALAWVKEQVGTVQLSGRMGSWWEIELGEEHVLEFMLRWGDRLRAEIVE